jgi:4-amino-4-deoxy-L-arabinose transferase-like glycosyltransferase
MKKEKKNIIMIAAWGLYFVCGLFFLDKFPFMHSDESWLSGLTRTMMHEGMDSTETFFDLLPRYPHAIKSFFHMMQMPLIKLFGYELFSVRLLSLIFSCAALFVLYKIVLKYTGSKIIAFLSAVALALDVQFIYASHFARQEIIIAFGILLIYYYIVKNADVWSYKKDIITSIIIGAMIGMHPNAFIAALITGSIYIYYIAFEKKFTVKNLAVLVGMVAGFALVFVGISYIFDAQFIPHYLKYGDHLGVTMTFFEKVRAIVPFYQKLWLGISGTYYTPWIKIQMALFAAAIVTGAVYTFWDRKVLLFLLPIAAVNLGYIIIGRYSQPSILLMFIVCWVLVFYLLSRVKPIKMRVLATAALAVAMLTISLAQIVPYMNNDYEVYLNEIESIVPEDARVLANLNTEYAFAYDSLRDYRNLGYLDDNEMSFADYVKSNDIEYIIYPEEMDFIYENRPVWNIVYGNIYPYYDDMNELLKQKCEMVHEFYSPYGMRIVRFANAKDWSVKIYRVIQ